MTTKRRYLHEENHSENGGLRRIWWVRATDGAETWDLDGPYDSEAEALDALHKLTCAQLVDYTDTVPSASPR
jgi:hypothetical protein